MHMHIYLAQEIIYFILSGDMRWVTDTFAFNTLRPIQIGVHFADVIFKWFSLNENIKIMASPLKLPSLGPS